jgi:hypothetical protein
MKTETLALTHDWDKTFPKSDKVDHKKVTFLICDSVTTETTTTTKFSQLTILRNGKTPLNGLRFQSFTPVVGGKW